MGIFFTELVDLRTVAMPCHRTATATSVSGDGRVVVGAYFDGSLARRAFIWTEETRSRDLQEKFENELGLDLDGWQLPGALEISRDASTIIGIGIDPVSGFVAGWRMGPDAEPLVVNVTSDEPNDAASQAADECDVDLEEDGPQCTLRAAIELANERGGDSISFATPGEGARPDLPPSFLSAGA